MELEQRIVYSADLELRQDGRQLAGRFPYNKTATVADRGRRRKERFKSYAFAWQIRAFAELQKQLAAVWETSVEEAMQRVAAGEIRADAERVSTILDGLERRNIDLLAGHSYDRPLASLLRGTLRLDDTAEALTFTADLPPEGDQPAYMVDTLKQVRGKLIRGISPGFQVPPAATVPGAEVFTPEPGNPGVMIRDISQAVLYELSTVTRPAYAETTVDLRADDFPQQQTKRRRVWL